MIQWLRFHAPCAEGPGSIVGQGTRSHMQQLKCPHEATKAHHSQINKQEDLLRSEIELFVCFRGTGNIILKEPSIFTE